MIARRAGLVAALAALLATAPAAAEDAIRIGNTMPYSGPASAYGQIGEVEAACFRMINDEGGIAGRRIEFLSYDDGYSPPRTVEQTRKLVERDGVLLMFGSLGTPTSSAVRAYLNHKGVPQLFVAAGASMWGSPEEFPWTMGLQPNYRTEARIYARYVLENLPEARIAVLYQNDDYGRDYLSGFRDGLGERADAMIVAELPYETTDATVASQVIAARASGATVFFNVATPKFAAQAIRKAHAIGWHPVQFLNSVANSIGAVLRPAGLEASQGLISAQYMMDATDPQWADSEDVGVWTGFMDAYFPEGDRQSSLTVYGFIACMTLVEVLEQAGGDLDRETVMREAANLSQVDIPMLLPGITIDTSPSDYYPIEAMQLARFDGESWRLFGEIVSAETE